MLKKLAFAFLCSGLAFQANAVDKAQVDLGQTIWGTWTVYNAQNKCSETYTFKQPNQFAYLSLQKKMSGNFGVVRDSKNVNNLDILTMKVAVDNKKAACAGTAKDMTNQNVAFSLKWISPKTAQICMDATGQKCSSLYLIKQ
ncbi:hypothetical protein [Acinetobacter sp. MD2]|uniref:hypothetical protein n=1 Tax=Acinetobacter sp. MD2 TaxID=2600066 RepID=UPI002D1F434D|nr:hypothetical protein [Acinetobacter sp. MD2]MEB3767414.1 hypothetical protein [Acinetobacter sp. MD2]